MLMLRNLVSSLLEHQQIRTTIAKAKEAAPLVEKMITLGKRGTLEARRDVVSFVLNPKETVPKLFTEYAERYKYRPGGYTRIHHLGNRFGDHAPMAVLELVDNPHDLRFAMTARAVGRETLRHFLESEKREEAWGAQQLPVEEDEERAMREARELDLASEDADRYLRPNTRLNRAKVLRYRGEAGKEQLNAQAREYVNELLSEPERLGGMRRTFSAGEGRPAAAFGVRPWAGERLTGMDTTRVGLGIAAGALGGKKWSAQKWENWGRDKERKMDSEIREMEVGWGDKKRTWTRERRVKKEQAVEIDLSESERAPDDIRSRLREVGPQKGPQREIAPPSP
ncbi:hypothetical protein CALVIDRAFT_537644 [Calocera viscosa TUFC12733]|uniref:Ribosomal protein L17 n=1 Tax=Calocera viscosa (strain TUFC12733) TaxID=1330018 RepID=A0A167LUX8_CALVF|nr:hypothetical protein CALVIDRAFT_537644 [Calocera viscosa TUFC12733]